MGPRPLETRERERETGGGEETRRVQQGPRKRTNAKKKKSPPTTSTIHPMEEAVVVANVGMALVAGVGPVREHTIEPYVRGLSLRPRELGGGGHVQCTVPRGISREKCH